MALKPKQLEGYHGRHYKTRRLTTFSTLNRQTGERGRMRAAVANLHPPLTVHSYDLEAQRPQIEDALRHAASRQNIHAFYTRWHNRYPRAQLLFGGVAKFRSEPQPIGIEIPTHVPLVNFVHFDNFLHNGINDFMSMLKRKNKYLIWFRIENISIRFYDHVRVPVPRVP